VPVLQHWPAGCLPPPAPARHPRRLPHPAPQVLDAALTKFRIKPQSQTWIQASMFRLYELLSTALFVLDESDPRLLELLQASSRRCRPGCSALEAGRWVAAGLRRTRGPAAAVLPAAATAASLRQCASGGGCRACQLTELRPGPLPAARTMAQRLPPLQPAQALAANVSPGSDAHLFWSMQYRGEVEVMEGRMDSGFRHADKLCQQAFGARYGRLTKGLYRQLLEARLLALADEDEEGEGEDAEE
jgi:hypothetical protein